MTRRGKATLKAAESSHRGGALSLTSLSLPLVVAVALLIRMPLLGQSLWYDEIVTLSEYVLKPWGQIVSGNYSPNNHVLFSLAAKAMDELTGGELTAIAARLPSVLAGAAVGVVLALPVRRRSAGLAVILAAIVSLNPWLVSFSGWARGYALLLLLGVLSTYLLMRGWLVAYAVAVVAMLYTHPIGVAVVVGHAAMMGLAVIFDVRGDDAAEAQKSRTATNAFAHWAVAVGAAAVLSALLYLPFASGVRRYWSQVERPSIAYGQFLAQSLRHAHAGENIGGIASIIVAAVVCTGGAALAWRNKPLRPMIVTFGSASAFALLVPLAVPAAGEARAAIWLIPLYGIGMLGILTALSSSSKWRWPSIAAGAVLAAFLVIRLIGIWQTPGQPLLDAVQAARKAADRENERVIGIYMAANEAKAAYGGIDFIAYKLSPENKGEWPSLRDAEARAGAGKRPFAIVFYGQFLQRDQPDMWRYIQQNYQPIEHLAGRVSPATIYRRKPIAAAP